MTDQQWDVLLRVIRGEEVEPLPTGFIIDSPWLPNWAGMTILDYFTSDQLWFEANKKAIDAFPDTMFLPGFWSEYGMCSEPSAFGAKTRFPADEFPHAYPAIFSNDEIDKIEKPRAEQDGLAPFILNRLKLNQQKIEDIGHKIRFSVSRGPLNIASYLMGSTEFLMALISEPERVHKLLRIITDYLKDWHQVQQESIPTIDGMLVLDDIIGFIGEDHFKEFALPYCKEIFDMDVSVKFLHNDAPCKVSAPYLPEMGVNFFNPGYDVSLNELKELTNHQVTILGNLPPRDTLALKSPEEVWDETKKMINELSDRKRIVLSAGGGMSPGTPTENLKAFIDAAKA
ncbi:MAG: uroporphyrinogen decarboxylase family protein [Marinilabiliaceae bacterium]